MSPDIKFTTAADFVAEQKGIPVQASLIEQLRQDVLDIRFKKLDGDERVMTCTKSFEIIPKEHHPKSDKPGKEGTITVWVPEAKGWRSFRYERVIEVGAQGTLKENMSNSVDSDQNSDLAKTV